MDGLSRALGSGPTIEVGGRTLSVKGKILRHYGEIEAEIIKQRGNPLEMIGDAVQSCGTDTQLARAIVAEALSAAKEWRFVSGEETHAWMHTFNGHVFTAWLAIRHNDPPMRFEEFRNLYCDELERIASEKGPEARQEKMKEVESSIDQASGEDELGNSTGPEEGQTVEHHPV